MQIISWPTERVESYFMAIFFQDTIANLEKVRKVSLTFSSRGNSFPSIQPQLASKDTTSTL